MSRQNKSIEEKTSELEKLVSWFDSEEFTIEKALEKFKEAEKLAAEIESDLSTIKNEIEIVKKRFDA
jgi:exodeoxyribonuclease VII small subunit